MRYDTFWCYRRILLSKQFIKALWRARENVLADARGSAPPAGPYLAEMDVTYRCNCRCSMCQRWQDLRRDVLELDEYGRLAAELHALGTHQISIAGGEPLLREDVFAIIGKFVSFGMSVNLCTNGMLVDRYMEHLCDSGATCITVSVDGATAKYHDALRGTPGSFVQVTKGLEALLRKPARSRPIVRVRMTVSDYNVHELGAFYRNWHAQADDVLVQPVHQCATAYYTGDETQCLRLSPDRLAAQIIGKPLDKSAYLQTLIRHLRNENAYPTHHCYAGILMARIDPWGAVYPCLEQHRRVGSVRKDDFATIWDSSDFNQERLRLAERKDCRCWFNNTALIGYYGRLLRYSSVETLVNRNHQKRGLSFRYRPF